MIPQGEPFMESLINNRPMLYSISISGGAIIALASGLLPEANEYFELVQLPTEVCRTGEITYRELVQLPTEVKLVQLPTEVCRTELVQLPTENWELVQLPTENLCNYLLRTCAITYRELVQLPTENLCNYLQRTGAITYRELVQLPTEGTDIVGAFVIDRTLQLLCGTGKHFI
ncbi:hypothetical protein DPMN_147937 [Dreissena polymorpha]|uniref:Uncharacterized protein n=1 Tax=Dreissena polymorpha TaxID=45954 RepID=A0A9D4J3E2_DREPO|nr:hypothetical protein DPMN_147937 [Dreissena polymorpha]